MGYRLNEICSKFAIETPIESYGNGHINETYLCEGNPGFILQKINTNIFKKPDEVMENIYNVTEHLKKKIEAAGGDVNRETLNVVQFIYTFKLVGNTFCQLCLFGGNTHDSFILNFYIL